MWLEREENFIFCLFHSLKVKCPKLKIEKSVLAMLRTFQGFPGGSVVKKSPLTKCRRHKVQSPGWEAPKCHRATEPMLHNYRTYVPEPMRACLHVSRSVVSDSLQPHGL